MLAQQVNEIVNDSIHEGSSLNRPYRLGEDTTLQRRRSVLVTGVLAGSTRRAGDIFPGLSSHTQVRQDLCCITVICDDVADGLFIEFFGELRCITVRKRL